MMTYHTKSKKETWKGIPRNKIDWFPSINYDKCISCMTCVNFCTHGVYAEKCGKPKVVKPKNCVVGCTGCDHVCKQKAVSHPPKSYLRKLMKKYSVKSKSSGGHDK